VIKYILYAHDNGDSVEGHDIVTFVKKEFDIEVSLSWPQSFQKTHSNLICETDAIPLENERGNVSYSELLDYSIEMELLKDYNFQNVWNWDESSDEPKSYSSKRVFASIAAQNKKISYKMKRHVGHITYLWCICADGDCLPPLIIISQLLEK
jgi:hypothetical protein